MILCPQTGQHKLIEVRKATQNTLLNFAPTKQHEIIFGITPFFLEINFSGKFFFKIFQKIWQLRELSLLFGFLPFQSYGCEEGAKRYRNRYSRGEISYQQRSCSYYSGKVLFLKKIIVSRNFNIIYHVCCSLGNFWKHNYGTWQTNNLASW